MYTIDKYSYFENDKKRNLPLWFRRVWLFNLFWGGQKSIHVFFVQNDHICWAADFTIDRKISSVPFVPSIDPSMRTMRKRCRKSGVVPWLSPMRGPNLLGIDMKRKFEPLMNKAWLLFGGLVYPKNNFQNYTVSKLVTAPHLINWMFSNPDLILWVKTLVLWFSRQHMKWIFTRPRYGIIKVLTHSL